jgi:hypothetical protein
MSRYALTIVLTSSMLALHPTPGAAENIIEFPFPEIVTPSRQASATLLAAVSTAFRAAQQAELGASSAANGQMNEAVGSLREAQKLFAAVTATMRDRKIDYSKAPKEIGGIPIERILAFYHIAPPQRVGDLGRIASDEIANLEKMATALKFGDKTYSRAAFLHLNDALHRMLTLGLVISVLADAAEG